MIEKSSRWQSVPLGECVEELRGGASITAEDFTETGFQVLHKGTIQLGGTLVFEREGKSHTSEEYADKHSSSIVDDNYVVATLRNLVRTGETLGFIASIPPGKTYLLAQGAYGLRLNPSKLHARYLAHLSNAWVFHKEVLQRMVGTTQVHIRNGDFLSIPIPLPPLAEQRRIAEVLDRAEALRAKRRAALSELDTLTQSLFLDLFGDPVPNPKGWPTSPLVELGQIHTGKTPPTKLPDMFGGDIPFATPGDLDGTLASTERTLTDGGAEYTRVVRAGSALVGCIGNIGKMAKTPVCCAFNQQINAVEWNRRIHDDYGIAALEFAIPQMMALSSSTTVPILNKSGFAKVKIRVPPIELQLEFARQVTAVEKLKATHRAFLAELDALFASLQHRAFRGEL